MTEERSDWSWRVAGKSIRIVHVCPGDVFGVSRNLVVVSVDATHANVRESATGKRSRVMVRRLQREYARCGEIVTARAHRELAKVEKREAAKAKTKNGVTK